MVGAEHPVEISTVHAGVLLLERSEVLLLSSMDSIELCGYHGVVDELTGRKSSSRIACRSSF